jgi:probable HAF family extracellular repeat protein
MIDLGTVGGTIGGPNALNNQDQVIGSSNLVGDQIPDPFLWDDGKLTDLNTDTIGRNPITANAINDSGEIVGTAAFPGLPFNHAYLWRNGVAKDLGTVNDDCASVAFAINSKGQVVGQSFSCVSGSHAFLWENGSMVDLNSVIPPNSTLQLLEAQAINDRGEIAGDGFPPGCTVDDQCVHAYLLIPVCADGSEGCADAPLDPALATQNRTGSGGAPKTMTAEELAIFKQRIVRMAGRKRGFGFWPRR